MCHFFDMCTQAKIHLELDMKNIHVFVKKKNRKKKNTCESG